MAEGGGGYVGGSTEEIAENREQQDIEIDMLQSIFESEMVVVNPGTEYLVSIVSLAKATIYLTSYVAR